MANELKAEKVQIEPAGHPAPSGEQPGAVQEPAANAESKIELTTRLRAEGRWAEASKFKDETVKSLRASGMKRNEAGDLAWQRMAEAYPPVPAAKPTCKPAVPEHPVTVWPRDEAAWNAAFVAIPDRCPHSVALDWIASHPAMSRLQEEGKATVVLTVDDVLNPPHGKAPSRGAVMALQNWANRPNKFYEMMLSEQKKQVEDPEAKNVDLDPGLEEVERMLKQLYADFEQRLTENVPETVKRKVRSCCEDWSRRFSLKLPAGACESLELQMAGVVGDCMTAVLDHPGQFQRMGRMARATTPPGDAEQP